MRGGSAKDVVVSGVFCTRSDYPLITRQVENPHVTLVILKRTSARSIQLRIGGKRQCAHEPG